MSKLRNAVSRARITRLGQDIEPQEKPVALVSRRRQRRARAPLGGHEPANGNAGTRVPEEPQAIREARARLRGLIAAATKDAPKPSVGIVLAIVNQETGNHAAANALIEEYGLERLFGIRKFCPNG